MTLRRKRSSVDAVVARIEEDGESSGDTVPSGFPSLDALIGGGFRKRDLIVLGGDVGVGKSALALAFALRAVRQGTSVLFATGEMTEDRLMERALAIEGRVRIDDLRAGAVRDPARADVRAAALWLRGAPLEVRHLDAADFSVFADQLSATTAGLVVVDYLQLVPAPAGRTAQDEDLALVLRHLKALTISREVPLLVVTQLATHARGRVDPRPTLDDFGALGSVKQHADVVLALYREEMHRPGPEVEGATELIVAKNRNSPTGFVDLYFYHPWMRFEDMLDPER
jgi:replicative DNA helicase